VSPIAKMCHRHGRIVIYGEQCPECTPSQQPFGATRPRSRPDPEHTRLMNSHRWKKARAAARRRDGGCVRRDEGNCLGRIEVHHRVSVRDGGSPYDLENLVTLCVRHHRLAEWGR
jgi:5-methylcytosine-specific restriction endonuclease McrA